MDLNRFSTLFCMPACASCVGVIDIIRENLILIDLKYFFMLIWAYYL